MESWSVTWDVNNRGLWQMTYVYWGWVMSVEWSCWRKGAWKWSWLVGSEHSVDMLRYDSVEREREMHSSVYERITSVRMSLQKSSSYKVCQTLEKEDIFTKTWTLKTVWPLTKMKMDVKVIVTVEYEATEDVREWENVKDGKCGYNEKHRKKKEKLEYMHRMISLYVIMHVNE